MRWKGDRQTVKVKVQGYEGDLVRLRANEIYDVELVTGNGDTITVKNVYGDEIHFFAEVEAQNNGKT